MSDSEKAKALAVFGLGAEANKAQIEQAYKALIAFSNSGEPGSNGAVSGLADKLRAEAESAYKILTTTQMNTSGGTGTKSDTTDKNVVNPQKSKNSSLVWFIGLVLVGGLLYQSQKKAEQHDVPMPVPDQNIATPVPTPAPAPTQSGDSSAPLFAIPFVHNDDVRSRAVRWTSGYENVNGTQTMVVWAYANNNDPVYKIELYSDNGTWREQRQYVMRYSSNRLQVDVQRFQDQSGAAAIFKDQRNISNVGDVLVQTTIYMFSSDNKLYSVQVDTPFATAKDGLRITRYGSSISAERVPSGGPVNIASNPQWLNNLFDLWSVFGAPNL